MSGFTLETNTGNQLKILTRHLAHAAQERSSVGTDRTPEARESRWNSRSAGGLWASLVHGAHCILISKMQGLTSGHEGGHSQLSLGKQG